MFSLFRKDPEKGWHYREAWHDSAAGEFVIHHGRVGTNGRITAERASADDADALLASFAERCEADGYGEPSAQELTVLKVVYPLKSTEPGAAEKRNAETVHEALLPTLAWRGLGVLTDPTVEQHDDGSSALVMRVSTLHRNKAQQAVTDAVKSTDVQPAKVRVQKESR